MSQNSYLILYQDEEQAKLRAWWNWLDDNRGDRALLRRAACVDDILLTPSFARFLKVMPAHWSKASRLFDSAMVAGLLARVRTDGGTAFAEALAMPREKGMNSAMSELRFRQLQKSRNADEFFLRMIRAIALIDNNVDVVSLADSVLLWLKEQRQAPDKNPQRRLAVRWAFDYYTNLKD